MAGAQVGMYGIGQGNLDAALSASLRALRTSGLPHEVGGMGTIIDGADAAALFHTLGEMYQAAAEQGEVVMTVTRSNACPVSLAG